MIVGVHGLPVPTGSSQFHRSQIGDHLVDIHVGGGPRTGLKNIDGKLVVVNAG